MAGVAGVGSVQRLRAEGSSPVTTQVQEAIAKIRALRRLSRTTPVKTHRSQYRILESLSPEELAEAALILEKDETENVNQR
jgi:hypothetical protein